MNNMSNTGRQPALTNGVPGYFPEIIADTLNRVTPHFFPGHHWIRFAGEDGDRVGLIGKDRPNSVATTSGDALAKAFILLGVPVQSAIAKAERPFFGLSLVRGGDRRFVSVELGPFPLRFEADANDLTKKIERRGSRFASDFDFFSRKPNKDPIFVDRLISVKAARAIFRRAVLTVGAPIRNFAQQLATRNQANPPSRHAPR